MKKAIAFGDSILKGVVPDSERRNGSNIRYTLLDNNFTHQCGERLEMEIDNFGKFGGTVTAGESILNRHVKDICKARFTLLEFGGNDSDFDWQEISKEPHGRHFPHTDLRTFSLTYKGILDRVRHLGSHPIILSLPPLDPDRYFEHVTRNMNEDDKGNVFDWLGGSIGAITNWHELYNIQLFKLGMAMKVPVIDITSSFLFKKDFKEYLCQDGIHPNEKGHRLIADAICDHFNFKR